MAFADHQRHALRRAAFHFRTDRLGFYIPEGPQLHRIVLDGSDHFSDIVRRAVIRVFSLQNRLHHFSDKSGFEFSLPGESVIDQERHAHVIRLDRTFISSVDDGPRPILFIETKTPLVLF